MLKIKIIAVGTLSEPHWRAACDEYKKRLTGHAQLSEATLKEERLGQSPSDAEIARALDAEALRIIAEIPKRALVVPLCVEGRQFSSPDLARRLDSAAATHGEVCFIIGSSFGLSDKVKNLADLKLSLSELTFPHQLARVMLYETVYRCVSILAGAKYHK